MRRYGVFSTKSNFGKNYFLYFFGHQTKSKNGVDILVEENQQVNFEPISERVCTLHIK